MKTKLQGNTSQERIANIFINISIIGSRGIPAKYGGFEVFAEKLSTKLCQKGFSVKVCCEYEKERQSHFRGVNLDYFPFPPPANYFFRKFYEIFNDIYFMLESAKSSDVMYILGVTAGLFTFLPKIFNKNLRLLVNIDGLEWKRDKYNKLEKLLLKASTITACKFADIIILDSQKMRDYIDEVYQHKAVFIPYGATAPERIVWDRDRLESLSSKCKEITSIRENAYWLEVARLEPDNKIHMVIEAFLKSKSKMPLIIVGDYTSEDYRTKLENLMDIEGQKRIFMVGGIYQDKTLLDMLRQNCFSYIHAHSFGGTNPSLLEAMIRNNIILAHDNEFNREVCGDFALYFKNAEDLRDKIQSLETEPNKYIKFKDQAYERAKKEYSWNRVANDYEKLFLELVPVQK